MNKKDSIPEVRCCVKGEVIPKERVKFLISEGIPFTHMTCVKCSTTTKKQGIFLGEYGTSELRLVSKVYNDSVRSVFRRSEAEAKKTSDEEEEDIDNTRDTGYNVVNVEEEL